MTESQRASCVRRLADGDADALQYLIVEYHPMLRRAVGRAIEPALRRLVEPDDVLQQAYIAAFRKFADGRFDGPAHFYNWLQQIAQNELRGIQRGLHRRKRDIGRQLTAARHAPGRPDLATSYPDLLTRLTAGDTPPSGRLRRCETQAMVAGGPALDIGCQGPAGLSSGGRLGWRFRRRRRVGRGRKRRVAGVHVEPSAEFAHFGLELSDLGLEQLDLGWRLLELGRQLHDQLGEFGTLRTAGSEYWQRLAHATMIGRWPPESAEQARDL